MSYPPTQDCYGRQKAVFIDSWTQSCLTNGFPMSDGSLDSDSVYPSLSYSNVHPSSRGNLSQDLSGYYPQDNGYFETASGSVHPHSYDMMAGPSTSSRPYSQVPGPYSFSSTSRRPAPPPGAEHVYSQITTLTHSQIVNAYVRDVQPSHGRSASKYFACKYSGCTYPNAFCTEHEAVQHVHMAHLNLGNQAFVCTACGVVFARKQDAVRHVKTMNEGKKYICDYCHKAYSRKDYRDSHQDRCSGTNALRLGHHQS